MSFSEQGLTQQELLKTNKKLVNKIIELEQQKNTLEQYLRIEKEVSNETIKELEQQKAELMEFVKTVYNSTQCSPELFIGYRDDLKLKSYALKQKYK